LSDLGEKLDEIEGLKDKSFTLFGLRMTPTTIGMAIAGIGSVLGALYGGFTMYQKVEELASLDIGGYQAQMEQTSNKIETQERLLESIEQNLRDAKQLTYDIEKRVNDKIVRFEDKMDKFETKVEDTKAELEDKLQKALDNPLSGN
jgi:septal ring factor EnvC (AmiA/AmiB activator)